MDNDFGFAHASAIDKLPTSQQAVIVLEQFKAVKTQAEYLIAAKRWGAVRPQLQKYETACGDARAHGDLELAVSTFTDLLSAPAKNLIAIAEVAIALAEGDNSTLLDELKDAVLDIAGKRAEKHAQKLGDQAVERLRQALLRYLQSVSKRSRKHFDKIISAVFGTLSSLGGAVALFAKVFFNPSKIAPEWCGLLKEVDLAERQAFSRIVPLQSDGLSSVSQISLRPH